MKKIFTFSYNYTIGALWAGLNLISFDLKQSKHLDILSQKPDELSFRVWDLIKVKYKYVWRGNH